MSSTLPAPSSSKPAYQVHFGLPNDKENNCTSSHNRIFGQPQNTCPPPPASHAAGSQDPLSIDNLCLPPFWEKPSDSGLTLAIIQAQSSERRAESRLIRKRLARVELEHELYTDMERAINLKLRKAANGVRIFRDDALHPYGPPPVVGDPFEGDSVLESDMKEAC